MKCTHVRNRLLALPDPARVPEGLRPHLDACPPCRDWHRALLQMEGALASLPVPPSDGRAKAALLRRIHAEPAPKAKPAVERPRPFRELAATYWPAVTVAATLLIGTFAFLSLQNGKAPVEEMVAAPPDPMLDKMVQVNVTLATARDAAQRIDTLAQLADELHARMLAVANVDTGEGLRDLNQLYAEVIGGVTEQAEELNDADRDLKLEGIADRLARAGDRAEERAAEAHPRASSSLKDSAGVARVGSQRIRQILGRT